MRPMTFKVVTILLLAGGLLTWRVGGTGIRYTPAQVGGVLLVLAASLVPPVRRAVAAWLDRLRAPTPRQRFRVTTGIGIAAAVYLTATAHWQQRGLYPKGHDEQSYAIQVQMLARGRLWMPAHPVADAFDTVYVIVRPVYASMYFAGASLANVPMVWLGTPLWVVPVLLSAASVAAMYHVATELLDGTAGILAAAALLSLSQLRTLSVTLHSHVPMLLLGLLMWAAWLRWRRDPRPAWLAALGAVAGWGAITRPVDAIAYAAPVAVAILIDLRGRPRRHALASLAAAVAAAAPFVALQLVANRGITGDWLTTPHAFYVTRDFPNATMGTHGIDRAARPASVVPQKRELFEQYAMPTVDAHRTDDVLGMLRGRLETTLLWSLPAVPLVVFLPAALAGLRDDRRRWVVLAALPLFFGLYLLYPWYLPHYALIAAPPIVLGVLLGVEQVRRAWPRAAAWTGTFAAGTIVVLAVANLPEFNRLRRDDFVTPELDAIHAMLRTLPHRPAVVLFKRHPFNNLHEEPVYNTGVAWPDDAEVIRAHDLGHERNLELLRYYAERQPGRHVYFLDRNGNVPMHLGQAGPLLERFTTAAATTRPAP